MDEFRGIVEPLIYRPPNEVRIEQWRRGRLYEVYEGINARVNAGANSVANNISGTQVAIFKYVACSNDGTAVAMGDTSLPAEITTLGLARIAGTFGGYVAPASLGANFTYTITWVWNATGTYAFQKLGLFNALSAGTMLLETILGSAISGVNGDALSGTWTCNG